jgi:hypothetical protein
MEVDMPNVDDDDEETLWFAEEGKYIEESDTRDEVPYPDWMERNDYWQTEMQWAAG